MVATKPVQEGARQLLGSLPGVGAAGASAPALAVVAAPAPGGPSATEWESLRVREEVAGAEERGTEPRAGIQAGPGRVQGDEKSGYRVFWGKEPFAGLSDEYCSLAREKQQDAVRFLAHIRVTRIPQADRKTEPQLRLVELYWEGWKNQYSTDANEFPTKVCGLAKETRSAAAADTCYAWKGNAVYMLAEVSELLGDEVAAVTALKEVASSSSRYAPRASVAVAEYLLLVRKERYNVINAAKQVLASAELAADAHYILAWAYRSMGDASAAAEAWAKLERASQGGINASLTKTVVAERALFVP